MPGAIFLFAVAVRLLYLIDSADNPIFNAPIIDSNYYDRTARELVEKGTFSDQFFFQGFFYPLFLSLVYLASGCSMLWAKIMQCLVGAAACALTAAAGERAFDRRTGLLGGLILSLYGPFIFFGAELLATVWTVFWVALLLFILMQRPLSKSIFRDLLLGLVMALSVITRPVFLPFCVAAGSVMLWDRFRETHNGTPLLKGTAAMAAGFLVVAMPVAWVTHQYTGSLSFLPSSGGVNLFIGNNPDYEETIKIRPGMAFDSIRNMAFQEGLELQSDAERNRYFYRKVLNYAAEDPLGFLSGLARKALELASSREIPNNLDIYVFRDWSVTLQLLAWRIGAFGFPFGVLLPLALFGMAITWNRTPKVIPLFLLAYSAGLVLVHVNARYRLPLVPALSILASAGFVEALRLIRKHYLRRLATAWAVCVILMPVVILPGPFVQEKNDFRAETFSLVAEFHSMRGRKAEAESALLQSLALNNRSPEAHTAMGLVLMNKGDLANAELHFRKAIEFNPSQFDAWNNRGQVLSAVGNYPEAIASLEKALALSPDANRKAQVHVNLGYVHARAGNMGAAERQYRKAIDLRPNLAEAYNNLGILYAGGLRFEEAVSAYSRAIRIQPNYVQARVNLGALLAGAGRVDEALAQYREALEINRSFPMAHYNMGLLLHQKADLEAAEFHFRRAVEADPGYLKARYGLCRVLIERGILKEGTACLEAVAQALPGSTQVRAELFQARLLAGETDRARADLELIRSMDPGLASGLERRLTP